ncbi:MAG: HNH endonuclease [Candidatus Nitrotoga sp.]
MKLVNFASLDPAITSTGRTGLGKAGSLDREVWAEFMPTGKASLLNVKCSDVILIVQHRRKMRLMSYLCQKAIPAKLDESLLSRDYWLPAHIVPWSKDKANRLNLSNGLCLSAIHDRAFDKGLITLTNDFKIVVSKELKRKKEPFIIEVLLPLDSRTIEPPERFTPQAEFIAWHRKELFWTIENDGFENQRKLSRHGFIHHV